MANGSKDGVGLKCLAMFGTIVFAVACPAEGQQATPQPAAAQTSATAVTLDEALARARANQPAFAAARAASEGRSMPGTTPSVTTGRPATKTWRGKAAPPQATGATRGSCSPA